MQESTQVWRRRAWIAPRAGELIRILPGRTFVRLLATLTQPRGDGHATRREPAAHAARTTAGGGAAASSPSPAFDAFFAEHERPLYGYVRRLVSGDDAALDIAQEAFVRAWQHFDELQEYNRPAAWLYRVATNLAISHLRRRVPPSLSQLGSRTGAAHDTDDPASVDEFLVDPANFAEANAERDLINVLLRRLPERQRAALLLRAVHGCSYDEIAAVLELSPAAARQTLSRGRERFRALYAAAQRGSGDRHVQPPRR